MNARKKNIPCSTTQITHGRLPRLPFSDIKNAVLGKRHEISIVFIGNALSVKLNRIYRKKNSPANILSFPLEHNMGEIFINMPKAQSDARIYKRTYKNQVGYLFIHGLFHLKGYRHNSTMERAEARVRKKFSILV
ncbi:MAG: rRNA maturation RNase YbeY [Parcubacteria group bacterium]|nr:rRNA maturation RNase YbeY [Parcubacteria group bacterium]